MPRAVLQTLYDVPEKRFPLPLRLPSALFQSLDRIYRPSGWKRFRYYFQYLLRLAVSGRAGWAFIEQLSNSPALDALTKKYPRFFIKPFRGYLNARWSARRRAEAAWASFSFIRKGLHEEGRRLVFIQGNHPLAEISLGPDRFAVLLTYHDCYEKEGEFTLKLTRNGEWLCALTFSMTCHRRKARVLYIGCLQSHNHPEIKEQIRDTTRAFHGLRPKALLFLAAQQIAQAWQAEGIVAVGDATHVHESLRFCFQRQRRKQAEYDLFWQELGGRRLAGDYLLPRRFRPRSMEEIKPNKRSLYRNRYGMLATVLPEMAREAERLVERP